MKCSRLLFVWVLLLQSLVSLANPIEKPLSCSLPAPDWINATNVTSSSITVEWAGVNGAYGYRVSRYDVTHGVQLPDADVSEPKYISQPHDPGTTISFEVWPKCENEELGSSIGGEYTTSFIIVDDIASFTAPNLLPQDSIAIWPNADSPEFKFTDAPWYEPGVDVAHLKLTFTDRFNVFHSAEVLMWSHCSNPVLGGPRVMYWKQNTWKGGVSYEENHLNNNPAGPVVSITFRYSNNTQPFFTIYKPTLSLPEEGPYFGGLTIHNDRQPSSGMDNKIYFRRVYNTEHNPCYDSLHQHRQGRVKVPMDQVSFNNEEILDRSETRVVSAELAISPNPFSDGFNADYTLETESPVTFCLFDLTGRKIKTMQLPTLAKGHYSTGISTDDLPAGIYMLSFQTNQGHHTTTLVKH